MYYIKCCGHIDCYFTAKEAWDAQLSYTSTQIKLGYPITLQEFTERLDSGEKLHYGALRIGFDVLLIIARNAIITDSQLSAMQKTETEHEIFGYSTKTVFDHLRKLNPEERGIYLYFYSSDEGLYG